MTKNLQSFKMLVNTHQSNSVRSQDLPFRQHTGDKLKTCQAIKFLGQDLNPKHPKYETRALTTLTVTSHLFK